MRKANSKLYEQIIKNELPPFYRFEIYVDLPGGFMCPCCHSNFSLVTLFPHIDFNMLLCCSSLHVVLFSMILLALSFPCSPCKICLAPLLPRNPWETLIYPRRNEKVSVLLRALCVLGKLSNIL